MKTQGPYSIRVDDHPVITNISDLDDATKQAEALETSKEAHVLITGFLAARSSMLSAGTPCLVKRVR